MTAAPAGGGLAEVLDTLHDCALRLRDKSCTAFAADLDEARAAIAELIEADKEYDAALGLVRQTEATYGKRSAAAGRARAALDLANERRAAALSNIEGASHG